MYGVGWEVPTNIMDRLEKRIDEKIDSKLSSVMDRLSVLDTTSNSTRCGSSSLSDNGGSTGQSSATGVALAGRSSPNCDWELVLILTP